MGKKFLVYSMTLFSSSETVRSRRAALPWLKMDGDTSTLFCVLT
jgi:hypothetical protein